jgi:hypothetical protein
MRRSLKSLPSLAFPGVPVCRSDDVFPVDVKARLEIKNRMKTPNELPGPATILVRWTQQTSGSNRSMNRQL